MYKRHHTHTHTHAHTHTLLCIACRLALLNSTVAQLAKATNHVLSTVYTALYDEDDTDDDVQLKLHTAPLAASEEIVQLYNSQIIDIESALPAALHALAVPADEIKAAMQRAEERQEEQQRLQAQTTQQAASASASAAPAVAHLR